jgi:hypothetical protein
MVRSFRFEENNRTPELPNHRTLSAHEDRVLVGVGRRATAEEHQRLLPDVPDRVPGARRDQAFVDRDRDSDSDSEKADPPSSFASPHPGRL